MYSCFAACFGNAVQKQQNKLLASCMSQGKSRQGVYKSLRLAGNINERGMLLLFSTLEIILQSFPKEGPALLQPVLQRLLVLILSDKESGLTVSSKPDTYCMCHCSFCKWFDACSFPPQFCMTMKHQRQPSYRLCHFCTTLKHQR